MEFSLIIPALKTFSLIFLAEMGDKSQLVCMSLAARQRVWPVVAGAVAAFALLNLLAVTLGATIAAALPQWVILALVSVAFLFFGLQALRATAEDETEAVPVTGRSLLIATFLLIFVAEFGDKTQLAVAGLSGIESVLQVWLGATLALAATSVLGVMLGKVLLTRVPLHWMQRGSGILFIGFAIVSAVELVRVL
ncbi:TMEM165/GDT1 family protein [Marinobacterium jannaschii]|uniref:TMEM165/GDT1 family protein n=1 Tax=Marinobacterium jannaschii TaxID=64970 RepID=UPI0004819ACE|nr:TMEM165/GDT1 family protein [Marinobacterium jannaschii]